MRFSSFCKILYIKVIYVDIFYYICIVNIKTHKKMKTVFTIFELQEVLTENKDNGMVTHTINRVEWFSNEDELKVLKVLEGFFKHHPEKVFTIDKLFVSDDHNPGDLLF